MPNAKQPVAIVILHKVNLRHRIQATGVHPQAPLAQLCRVKMSILNDLNSIGKKNGFKSMVILEGVVLTLSLPRRRFREERLQKCSRMRSRCVLLFDDA
jgi:hypothetical protein